MHATRISSPVMDILLMFAWVSIAPHGVSGVGHGGVVVGTRHFAIGHDKDPMIYSWLGIDPKGREGEEGAVYNRCTWFLRQAFALPRI
ncbi:hypothetical protein BCR34DRAFT_90300 [Clohesyomyces aquaticus]|uniref:Secreted protein n=1 Tax=Clohesyomyces aquaticus TaxID=1231657 RepID=A0A1Y1YUT1_9PLEO|nr:hypothetical protein BCR34DRAFT_90300 [Clohesyomyces aquaticus]